MCKQVGEEGEEMTKIECTETDCIYNVKGDCGKELIVMDTEAGWLTCTDLSYEKDVLEPVDDEENEDDK